MIDNIKISNYKLSQMAKNLGKRWNCNCSIIIEITDDYIKYYVNYSWSSDSAVEEFNSHSDLISYYQCVIRAKS